MIERYLYVSVPVYLYIPVYYFMEVMSSVVDLEPQPVTGNRAILKFRLRLLVKHVNFIL